MAYGKRRYSRKRPYRRKSRKATYKRRAKRMRLYKRPSRAILTGFPNSKLVKLRYVEHFTLDYVASIPEYRFRANSIFDPNLTGTGHQPMGRDQWAELYSRYIVIGSKATVTYVPTVAANQTPAYFGMKVMTDAAPIASTYGTVDELLEDKKTGRFVTIGGTYNTAPNPSTLQVTRRFSAKKTFALTNPLDDPDIGASQSSNPAKQAYFVCWQASIAGNDPPEMNFKICIDYITLMREPYPIVGS